MVLDKRFREAIAFKAPGVVDRLVKDRIAERPLAEQLFTEIKKYLVLCETEPGQTIGMYSVMVDEAWHAFILFTNVYTEYCNRFFGRYVDHSPDDGAVSNIGPDTLSFNDFRSRYENLFEHQLPAVWFDELAVHPARRVVNDHAGMLAVRAAGELVQLLDDRGVGVISVNDIARPALTFVTKNSDFYVRELPGDLTDEEKVGLIQPLVTARLLRVAP